MTTHALPARLIVGPHFIYLDEDYERELCLGFTVGYRSSEGWNEVFYSPGDEVTSWLAQRGYEQVSCNARRYPITGRYEHA